MPLRCRCGAVVVSTVRTVASESIVQGADTLETCVSFTNREKCVRHDSSCSVSGLPSPQEAENCDGDEDTARRVCLPFARPMIELLLQSCSKAFVRSWRPSPFEAYFRICRSMHMCVSFFITS